MQELARVSELEGLARSLDTLITFADKDRNFVLAATLDTARVLFLERYGQPAG